MYVRHRGEEIEVIFSLSRSSNKIAAHRFISSAVISSSFNHALDIDVRKTKHIFCKIFLLFIIA
jgi:hypothetical protein